jgi:drug/metabolite transporter (DMT)-like permease
MQVYFAFMLFITIIASMFLLKEYGTKSISNRRYYKILFYFFITSVILLISPFATSDIVSILTIPLTFLFANYFLMMKRRKWAEILFASLVIISIILQYFG